MVDAAAALPPTSNLRAFTEAGADLVTFSGGKALRGPQASGILAGRRDLIQSVALQHQDMDVHPATWSLRAQLLETGLLPGPPLQGIGRPLKVGKEEIIGLLTALRLFVERDEAAEQAEWLAQVQRIVEGVAGLPEVEATVLGPPDRAVPVAQITWDEQQLGRRGLELVNALAAGSPPICVAGDGTGGEVTFSPFSLRPGEAEIVAERLRGLLGERK
jgi:L-seryl-tRNA(Ser) seleniumtransferase